MADEHDGFSEAYRPPLSDFAAADVAPTFGQPYVVSASKLAALFVSTGGFFAVYWFYKHWDYVRRAQRPDIWPIARAVLAIFFISSLFRSIDQASRAAGGSPAWEPNGQAIIYVVLVLGTRLLAHLGPLLDAGMLNLVSIGLSLVAVVPLLAAQRVVNHLAGDAAGKQNAALTMPNVLFIVLGMMWWGVVITRL